MDGVCVCVVDVAVYVHMVCVVEMVCGCVYIYVAFLYGACMYVYVHACVYTWSAGVCVYMCMYIWRVCGGYGCVYVVCVCVRGMW